MIFPDRVRCTPGGPVPVEETVAATAFAIFCREFPDRARPSRGGDGLVVAAAVAAAELKKSAMSEFPDRERCI